MNKLNKTFIDELQDTYDAEHQITKALPKMIEAAEEPDLMNALQSHLRETEVQIKRLEEVFNIFGEKPKGKKCKAMQGILAEGEDLIKEKAGDAALIAAGQKVEHYEIAGYGSLVAWAKLLKEDDAAEILEETLREEKKADEKLSEIAMDTANMVDAEAEAK